MSMPQDQHPDTVHTGQTGMAQLVEGASPTAATLARVRHLVDHPKEATAEAVLSLVAWDPVVASQVLRVANRAWYGMQRTVDGLRRAVELLGPTTVLGYVTGMTLRHTEPVASSCLARAIRHSVAGAHLAADIHAALPTPPCPTDVAYSAGLLHDLGRILILHHVPVRAHAVYGDTPDVLPEGPVHALEIEQLAFGHDHTEAGAFAARHYDYPERLVQVIYRHHATTGAVSSGASERLVAIVQAAIRAAVAFGYPSYGVEPVGEADPAWKVLGITDPRPLLTTLARTADRLRPELDGVLPAGRHTVSRAALPRGTS